MSKDPFAKLRSSLTLEDLLDQSEAYHPQNWLLTYLDVFVLTVMLVITLMALSDFKTQPTQVQAHQSQPVKLDKAPAANLPKAMTPEGNVKIDNSNGKNKAIPVAAPETVAAGQLPVIASAPQLVATQQAKPESETILPALPVEQEFKPIPLEQHAQPEPQPAPPIQPIDAEQELQADLSKTIQEFGLNDAVHIKVKQGYAQLEIQDKVLFKSSQADLTPDGAAVLTRLTPLLKQAEGLILIEGHTDNLPINTVQFPSNWELGSSRATSVLHFLTSQQLESSRMRAMTYADTQPIADNATSAGREKNRRVSILIKVADQQRQSDAE